MQLTRHDQQENKYTRKTFTGTNQINDVSLPKLFMANDLKNYQHQSDDVQMNIDLWETTSTFLLHFVSIKWRYSTVSWISYKLNFQTFSPFACFLFLGLPLLFVALCCLEGLHKRRHAVHILWKREKRTDRVHSRWKKNQAQDISDRVLALHCTIPKTIIQEDGCQIMNVQCSLRKLGNNPNAP